MLKNLIETYLNHQITPLELSHFDQYYEHLVAYNQHTNLTRITDRLDCDVKHFLDSLWMVKTLDLLTINELCDIGAGAGFPSIPAKILYPHLRVTIIESSLKRVKFLDSLIKLLDLKDVTLIHARAEEYGQQNRNRFDLVTLRAVGSISLNLELGIPILRVNGYLLLYKGPNYHQELVDVQSGIKKIKTKLIKTINYQLPQAMGMRTLLLFKKEADVLSYPRSNKEMKTHPL